MGNGKSRRKFLETASKSLGLVGISPVLSNFIVQTLSSQVLAAGVTNTSGTDKNYIFFALPGGPPRWFFDLPLTPNGTAAKYTDAFSHKGVGTFVGMQAAGDPQAIYKPWYDTVSKYWLPPVWGSNPAGGSFKNCLASAAFIRGVDFEINNHDLGRLRNQSPIIGGLSIAGLLAEKTSTAFPAAASGSISNAFKATKPISPVSLTYNVSATVNPISTVMRYFSGRAPVENLAVDQALSEFDKYADKNNFIQKSLTESKERSDALVTQGVKTFTDKWQPVYDRYLLKVKEAMSLNNTESFMDTKPITPPKMLANGNPDLRTRRADGTFMGDLSDYRKMVNDETTVANLAATYATVEILITMGLTQVVTADLGDLRNLVMNEAGGKFSLQMDQHFIGTLVSTIGTTFLYRAIINCTEELVLALKEKGLFDKTVIQFGAEFNRTAKADGSGSDHGFKGSSVLLISGMIKKTIVLGNIKDDPTSAYKGTWGMAAPHPLVGNNYPLRLNDVCKTVCGMLGLKNVSNNGEYILKNNGSQWEAFSGAAGEAKNV
ncbi:hypothetical protein CIK05_04550 [Bdellovibrio sp. qaytius]|nr:hypothetical protein CIK05_04550 [Bdellovibrio sp. qaytius]